MTLLRWPYWYVQKGFQHRHVNVTLTATRQYSHVVEKKLAVYLIDMIEEVIQRKHFPFQICKSMNYIPNTNIYSNHTNVFTMFSRSEKLMINILHLKYNYILHLKCKLPDCQLHMLINQKSYNGTYKVVSNNLTLKHRIPGQNHFLPCHLQTNWQISSQVEHEEVQKAISTVLKCPLSFSFTSLPVCLFWTQIVFKTLHKL